MGGEAWTGSLGPRPASAGWSSRPPRSNSAQERFKADSIERANAFLADAFAPKLRATLSESLGTEASVRCGAEEETVYFDYPRSYESAGTLDTIKLEI